MTNFWRLEEIKIENVYTLEEKACKRHFELNVKRNNDGRFTVVLPFRDVKNLGNSCDLALRRFQSNPIFKGEYVSRIY